jgi:hypothetical protein
VLFEKLKMIIESRLRKPILIAMVLIVPHIVSAADISIEDKDFFPISMGASAVIQKEAGNSDYVKNCTLVGKPIDLDGDGRAEDIFVTGKGFGCTGTARANFWLLRKKGRSFSVVLAFLTYGIELAEHKTRGLRNITLTAGSAGWSWESHWKFTGKRYKMISEKHESATN